MGAGDRLGLLKLKLDPSSARPKGLLSRLGPAGELVTRHERVHAFARSPLAISRKFLYYKARNLGVRARRGRTPAVCFSPEVPHSRYVMWKVCQVLGAKVTGDERACDLRYTWVDPSLSSQGDVLEPLPSSINGRCNDIRKRTIDEAHATVFGYRLGLDPTTHSGPCVDKADSNAAHDGRVIECPIPRRRPGRVYQRLIHTERDDGTVEDVRVPVVGDETPFVYIKRRPASNRFSNVNSHVHIAEADAYLDPRERERLLELSARVGLDVGEIDVLRDRVDAALYVVDVNKTCFGPPVELPFKQEREAVKRLGEAFERQFL